MKNSSVLFIIICFFSSNLFSQSLINNGNFELGDNGLPTVCPYNGPNTLLGLSGWENALNFPTGCGFSASSTIKCETPNWLNWSICSSSPVLLGNYPPLSTPSDAHFIFLQKNSGTYSEGIRTKLNAPLAKGNILRIKVKIANAKNSTGASYDAGLRIIFSKFGEHWKSDPLTTGNVQWVLEPIEFRINASDPHDWYTREFYVSIPGKVDGGNISDLQNMVIQLVGGNYSNFFLDDVEVYQQDPCNGACTPAEARDTIEFQVVSNPVQQWRKLTGNIDLNTTFQMQSSLNLPFAMNVKNVTYIEVRLIDGYGGIHNVLNVKNVNVLGSDDTLGFYQMWYWGAYADGSSIQSGVYAMEVSLFNCKTKSNNTVYFALQIEDGGIPTNPTPIPEDWVTVFENCCPVNATYNNINFTSTFKQSVERFIHAGTTGNTIVESNADVKFIAYEEIKLGQYWQVKQGATFNAVLAPCGFGKTAPSKPSKILVTNNGFIKMSQIKVYPNPVPEDDFTVEFDNDNVDEYKTIQIRDVLGKLVFSKKIAANTKITSTLISLGESPKSGIYFIEVVGSIQTLRTKFVIQ